MIGVLDVEQGQNKDNREMLNHLWVLHTALELFSTAYSLYDLFHCCEAACSLVQLAVALDDHQK